MRMARVNIYLPNDLAEEAKAAGLNISGIAQEALRAELASAPGRRPGSTASLPLAADRASPTSRSWPPWTRPAPKLWGDDA